MAIVADEIVNMTLTVIAAHAREGETSLRSLDFWLLAELLSGRFASYFTMNS